MHLKESEERVSSKARSGEMMGSFNLLQHNEAGQKPNDPR